MGLLVLGSANLDLMLPVQALPSAGQTVLGGDVVRRPGGKGANQAVAAALCGAEVAMAGCLGDDDAATEIRAALTGAGVDIAALRTAPGRPSGLAVVMVDADGENAIAVSPGANAAVDPAMVDAWQPHIATADVLLAQLELPVDAVVRALRLAHRAGTTSVLNLAPATPMPATALRLVSVLLVNESEAQGLLGVPVTGPSARHRAAAALCELGPGTVLLTAGADGAVLADAGGVRDVPAQRVVAVDTSGAGDAFAGAFAAALAAGIDPACAAGIATRAAAAAVRTPGAQLSDPAALAPVREALAGRAG